MASTLPDVVLTQGVWTDIYTATGILIGKPLYLINKSSSPVLAIIRSTQPAPDEESGIPLWPGDSDRSWAKVSSGAVGVWARSLGDPAILCVQEV